MSHLLPGAVSVALFTPRWCHRFFSKLFYIQLLIALVWLCTPPGGVTRLLAKFLSMTVPGSFIMVLRPPPPPSVVTCVFSDNCLLDAPGAFSVATYTPRWCVCDGPPWPQYTYVLPLGVTCVLWVAYLISDSPR